MALTAWKQIQKLILFGNFVFWDYVLIPELPIRSNVTVYVRFDGKINGTDLAQVAPFFGEYRAL